jgi:hypothetical protein
VAAGKRRDGGDVVAFLVALDDDIEVMLQVESPV